MKRYKFIFSIVFIIGMTTNYTKTFSQATSAGNGNSPTGAGEYLGWTSGTNATVNIKNEDNQRIDFLTNTGAGGTTPIRMSVTGGGKVGIGTTSPNFLLHQDNSSGAENIHQFTNSTTGNASNQGFLIGLSSATEGILKIYGTHPIQFFTSNTQRMEITGGGKVGIGTSSAQSLLHQHISSNSSIYHQFTNNHTGQTDEDYGFRIGLKDNGSVAEVELRFKDNAAMRFHTNAAERMAILGGGNVGIGVASPASKLEVDNGVNTNFYSVNVTNSAAYTASSTYTVGLISGTNGLSRSGGSSINEGLNLWVYGNQTSNRGVYTKVDEDYTSTTNIGGEFNAYRGSTNTGIIAVGGNDNNSSGSSATNTGVLAAARDASINYGVKGNAAGTNTSNFGGFFDAKSANATLNIGVRGEADSGTKNYAVYGVNAPTSNGCTATGTATCVNAAGYFAGDVAVEGALVTTSDIALKQNINPLANSLNIISQLQPKTFEFKLQQYPQMRLPQGVRFGFIAQDIEQVLPHLVKQLAHPATFDSSGNIVEQEVYYKGVNYIELIPILFAGIKDQQSRIDSLVSVIGSMPKAGNPSNLNNKENSEQKVSLSNSSEAILYQNQPNPFSSSTKINYFIPENSGKAEMSFYNATGVVMKSITISEKGQGTVEVDAASLTSAIYTYSLVIDGKVVDTKYMVKVK